MSSLTLELDPDSIKNIVDILPRYDKKIDAAEPIFQLEGRLLEEVARTLAYHQVSYEKSLVDVKGLEEWVNVYKTRKVGQLWKKYTEGYSRQLSTKDTQMYIEADPTIVEANQVLTEIGITKGHLSAIVDAIKQLSFSITNITKLRIAELEAVVL